MGVVKREIMTMKTNKNVKNGFTLIELIVAVAILAIVSIGFLTMFTSGFSIISRSGRQTKANYNAQELIEKSINDDSTTDANLTVTTNQSITVTFGVTPYSVAGTKIVMKNDSSNPSKTIVTFTTGTD